MNNKGFTLIEMLLTITMIALIVVVVSFSINSTLSISKEKSYDILKNNIINMANMYIMECEANTINCSNDYVWNDNKTSFYANKLVLRGYSSQEELINPINEKDISNCLIVNVLVDENKVYTVSLDDSKC